MANACTDKFRGEMTVEQSWWSEVCRTRKSLLKCVSVSNKYSQVFLQSTTIFSPRRLIMWTKHDSPPHHYFISCVISLRYNLATWSLFMVTFRTANYVILFMSHAWSLPWEVQYDFSRVNFNVPKRSTAVQNELCNLRCYKILWSVKRDGPTILLSKTISSLNCISHIQKCVLLCFSCYR